MTEATTIVERLRKRGDMIAAHHARGGKLIERPFTLEDLAAAEIERLLATVAKFVEIFEADDPFDRDHVGLVNEAMSEARALLNSPEPATEG